MKKFLKYSLVTMMLAFAVMFVGCAGDDTQTVDNEVNDETSSVIKSDSKLIKLMSGKEYYMVYNMEVEGQNVKSELTVLDGKSASVTTIGDMTTGVIVEGDTMYMYTNLSKTVTKLDNSANGTMEGAMAKDFLDVAETTEFTTGEEEVNGKKYYYEDFEGAKYYFDGNDLKYIKADDITIEVVEFSNKAKKSLLDLPAGYEVAEDSVGSLASALTGAEVSFDPSMLGEGLSDLEDIEMPDLSNLDLSAYMN